MGNQQKLTIKQQRFVEEFTADFNGTRAAIRAGYSESTAKVIASQNLTKLNIREAIESRITQLTMSADEATVRMSNFARGTFDFFIEVGNDNKIRLNLNSEQARNNRHLIKKYRQTERTYGDGQISDVITEIEIHDAKDAIKTILQLHGKFEQRVNLSGKLENMENENLNKLVTMMLNDRQL